MIAVCREASAELSNLGVRIIAGIDVGAAPDLLRLKREPGSATYWMARTPPGPARDSFDHQF